MVQGVAFCCTLTDHRCKFKNVKFIKFFTQQPLFDTFRAKKFLTKIILNMGISDDKQQGGGAIYWSLTICSYKATGYQTVCRFHMNSIQSDQIVNMISCHRLEII